VALRVVLDTSVLVAAIRSDRGASRVLLVGALERRYRLLVSVPLMIEYESVLTRAEHLEASGMSADDVLAILDAVAVIAEPVRLAYLWRPVLPDAEDDMVLETAVNGRADVLVTFNRRDFESAADPFAVKISSPGRVIERMRTSS
jgi:putative PIN family toxin of toxin-antitoxin system